MMFRRRRNAKTSKTLRDANLSRNIRPFLETLEDRTVPSTSIPLSSSNWTALGPATVTNGQIPGGGQVSGRVTGLATDPTNSNIMYVSTAGGGVWKTTNGGGSWTPLTDNLFDSAGVPIVDFVGAVALAPSNPQIIYAGTGEDNNSGDSSYGQGILVSRDGGNTWTLTGESQMLGLSTAQIAVDPQDPNTAYAAMGNSNVNGNPNQQLPFPNNFTMPATGIFKTTDGGKTWVNITINLTNPLTGFQFGVFDPGPPPIYDPFTAVVIDPQTHGVNAHVFMAVGNPVSSPENGVYESADGGQTFNLVTELKFGSDKVPDTDGPDNKDGSAVALAIARPNPQTLATVVASISDGLGNLKQLAVSRDEGAGWTDVTANLLGDDYMLGQGQYANAVAIDPIRPNIIFVGGTLLNQGGALGFNGGGVIESQDFGNTWTVGSAFGGTLPDINTGTNGRNGPHTDIHALTFDASDRLVLGSDGGVWRLDVNNINIPNISWTDLNSNLNTIQFTGIGINHNNPNIAYGGTQDNGVLSFNDSTTWNHIRFGDSGPVRVDPVNPSILYHAFPYIEDGTTAPLFERSVDGGVTWTDITPPQLVNSKTPFDDEGNFYLPYVIDPSNHLHVIIGTDQIYDTVDGGTTWTALPLTLPTSDDPKDVVPGIPIDSLAIAPDTVDPSRSSHLYVSAAGIFEYSIDDGNSWNVSPLSTIFNAFPPQAVSLDIAADPNDPTGDTVYVVSNALRGGNHVFMSTDGGATFTDITGNLPDVPADAITLVTNPNMIVVGTDVGVYATQLANGSSTQWFTLGGNFPHAQVTNFDWDPTHQILAVGTHGRGMWEILIQPSFHITGVSAPGNLTEGSPTGNITLATFTTNAAVPQASDFTATVNWGDGTTSNFSSTNGGIVANGGGAFSVVGGHTYSEEAANLTFTVTVTGLNAQSDTQSAPIPVVSDASLNGTAQTVNGSEGSGLNNVLVATFSDTDATDTTGDPASDPTDYTATITWTDSAGATHTTNGTVSYSGTDRTFNVFGTSPFSYATEGNFNISVLVRDVGSATTTITSTAAIAEVPIVVNPVVLNGTEGQPLNSVTVATFNDPGALVPVASDYTASVQYIIDPQGTTVAAPYTIVPTGSGNFNVVANLAQPYAEEGTFGIQVTVTPVGGTAVTANSAAIVSDAKLNGTPVTLTGITRGGDPPPNTLVASFTDTDTTNTAADPQGTIGDYTATITWDDGGGVTHTSPGTIVSVGGNSFNVLGTDTVPSAADGNRSVTVVVTDTGGATVTINSTLPVTGGPAVQAAGAAAVSTTEGTTFSATLGSFSDPGPQNAGTLAGNTVSINWGDGTSSSGTVTSTGGGNFTVSGTHAYANFGGYQISFTVTDPAAGATANGSTSANVAEAPLSMGPVTGPQNVLTGQPIVNFPVATFRDFNALATAGNFSAAINWGDGSSTGGTIQSNGNGSFTVLGSHTYNGGSNFTLTVTITESGSGQKISGSGQVTAGFIPIFGGNTSTPVAGSSIAAPSLFGGGGNFFSELFALFFAEFEMFLKALGL
jgi:hypothetical protein